MIRFRIKYCKYCEEEAPHEYYGKRLYWIFPLLFKKYWRCSRCGGIHEQDTAYLEDNWN